MQQHPTISPPHPTFASPQSPPPPPPPHSSMPPSFIPHPLPHSHHSHHHSHSHHTPHHTPHACLPSTNLYTLLNLLPTAPPSSIRPAYLTLAKHTHPDVASPSTPSSPSTPTTPSTSPPSPSPPSNFASITSAYNILSDPYLRRIYDTTGRPGLLAIQSIHTRAAATPSLAALDPSQLDYLTDSGQLLTSLLPPAALPDFDPLSVSHADACPRSVAEALWNVEHHAEMAVRYYALWWIYRFKVARAEPALVNVLQTSAHRTELGGYGLRRRAALALGAVAEPPVEGNQRTVAALGDALTSTDYFLRYRAAEALANIAQRADPPNVVFGDHVIAQLTLLLEKGKARFEKRRQLNSAYASQQSLFDLDKLQPEVREKLQAVFHNRKQNEHRSIRTTMTPQLGVDQVGVEQDDEPYEWLLKAIAAISAVTSRHHAKLVPLIQSYTSNSVPLVRYAAFKALYLLTGDAAYAQNIVDALEYGKEHHYSQRVLIRDLGDVAFCKGAAAVAKCPMVENSFKILALKNMLRKRHHDPTDPDVRHVLAHVDSLL